MNTPVILSTGGPLQGQSFPVDAHGVRIGRDPANEVCIPTPDVSRHHARVILHNGALWVQDAGSRNGVYVNGNRVSGHKQVSPGDRVVVGNSEFQVGLATDDTENSVSVNMDAVLAGAGAKPSKQPRKAKKPKAQKPPKAARAPGEKQWKLWPFAVAGGAVLGLLGLVALAGGGGGSQGVQVAPTAPVNPPNKYSLGGLADESDAARTEASGGTAEPEAPKSFGDMLSSAAGSSPDQMENWPKPPAGATFEDLRFKADTNFQQQRLRDSMTNYQMALQLNSECGVCRSRIDSLDRQIREEVATAYRDGVRYQDSHQYQQAIYAFERTLLLDPDKTIEDTLRSVEQIEVTKEKLPRQY